MDNYILEKENLNNIHLDERLNSLNNLVIAVNNGQINRPETGQDVNNHIHTMYSFSPYSPTKAVWAAYNAGLKTAGIMDHDSISGAREFIEAGRIIGMATTIGIECRVDFSGTPLSGRRINNPDQDSIAYIALHGIPHTQIDAVKSFFAPYSKARNRRNRHMVENLNRILQPYHIQIHFDEDVVPLSMYHEGGSITERHLLFALAHKLIEAYGRGEELVHFLEKGLCLSISERIRGLLLDSSNDFYDYDLLGLLKSEMVGDFYVEAKEECPDVRDAVEFAQSIGAISAYAYLGDVGDSVTGDKKTQKFEDDYLDLLFDVLKELEFNAVTYMPSRNSHLQLERVRKQCEMKGFFQISGEDINSPRQSFICPALRNKAYSNLIEDTWALIGHEKIATMNIENGLFSKKTVKEFPSLNERIKHFAAIGRDDL